MSVAQNIEHKLTGAFAPLSLKVIDESHLHTGHVGARPEVNLAELVARELG